MWSFLKLTLVDCDKSNNQYIVPSIETTTTDKIYRVFKGYVANATADIEGT